MPNLPIFLTPGSFFETTNVWLCCQHHRFRKYVQPQTSTGTASESCKTESRTLKQITLSWPDRQAFSAYHGEGWGQHAIDSCSEDAPLIPRKQTPPLFQEELAPGEPWCLCMRWGLISLSRTQPSVSIRKKGTGEAQSWGKWGAWPKLEVFFWLWHQQFIQDSDLKKSACCWTPRPWLESSIINTRFPSPLHAGPDTVTTVLRHAGVWRECPITCSFCDWCQVTTTVLWTQDLEAPWKAWPREKSAVRVWTTGIPRCADSNLLRRTSFPELSTRGRCSKSEIAV